MTALDCLSYLEEIKICTGYEVDGKVIKDFPTTPTLKKCKPVFNYEGLALRYQRYQEL